jgi:hypothetical protein
MIRIALLGDEHKIQIAGKYRHTFSVDKEMTTRDIYGS